MSAPFFIALFMALRFIDALRWLSCPPIVFFSASGVPVHAVAIASREAAQSEQAEQSDPSPISIGGTVVFWNLGAVGCVPRSGSRIGVPIRGVRS